MSQKQKPTNTPSFLLKEQENDILFQTMGRFCTTLATGVVQLFLADHGDRNRWSKRCCGVACFVKDNSKRSFYIRIYDIKKQQMIWEQELYNQFVYKTPREYFHTFEAENCQAALNFASEDEALKFKKTVDGKLQERSKKRQERKKTTNQKQGGRPIGAAPQRAPQPAVSSAQPVTHSLELGRNNNLNTSTGSLKKDKKKDAKKKLTKLTKADIGTPSDFRHVSHVGWDPDKGFDMNNLDPDMQTLFQSVGINSDDDVDKEIVDFIYDFVEKHGGIEAVKKEFQPGNAKSAPPPPPPNRGNAVAAPPHPPSRVNAPPVSRAAVPPPPPPSRGAPMAPRGTAPPPPSRVMPPPPSRGPGMAPPPPPSSMPTPPPPPPSVSAAPPPPPSGPAAPPPPPSGPAVPPPPPPPPLPADLSGGGEVTARDSLMDAIRSGKTLKQAQPNEDAQKAPPDSRGQLLDAIRQGANLKKVDPGEKPPTTTSVETDGLVGALARALANRQKQIHGSDDEDDSDDDDEDVDDDDDDWDD